METPQIPTGWRAGVMRSVARDRSKKDRSKNGVRTSSPSVRTGINCLHRLAFALALLFLTAGSLSHPVLALEGNAPGHLQCESMPEPLGIDITQPRLSWQLQDSRRGARQTAYQVRVANSAESLAQDHADVWDSGRVDSDQSVNVSYGGPAVESRRRYYWQVRVWDSQEQPSPYSQPSWWEMGLLSSQDWKARWITRDMPLERGDYESS